MTGAGTAGAGAGCALELALDLKENLDLGLAWALSAVSWLCRASSAIWACLLSYAGRK